MRTPQTQVAGKTGDLGGFASQLHRKNDSENVLIMIMGKLLW